jgi:hypothetical protein
VADSNRELFDALIAAHPGLTNLGLAEFALAEDPRVDPAETECPVCGVMLTEDHTPS